MLDIATNQFGEAVDRLAGKTPIASKLRTKEWQDVPLALRDRAFFSAGIDELRTVQTLQDKLDEWANLIDRDPDRAFIDRKSVV